jgi:two-component system response regulator TctD
MDRDTDVVQMQGRLLALTPREVAALRVLLESPQRPVSKEQLHAQVFADEVTGLEAVEVLIYRLRKKLEVLPGPQGSEPGLLITTFRGLGYMLTLPASPAD